MNPKDQGEEENPFDDPEVSVNPLTRKRKRSLRFVVAKHGAKQIVLARHTRIIKITLLKGGP